jgi:hypothetical protein
MFAYVPGDGAKLGDNPPYKWQIVGVKDTKTNQALSPDRLKKTITDRLPCFLGE